MSAAAKLTKKQRKALAFRERKGKGKAKASEDDVDNDIPVMEDQDLAEAEVESARVESQEASRLKDRGRPQMVEGKKRTRDADELGDHDGEKTKPKKRKTESKQAGSIVAEGYGGEATEKESTEGGKKDKQQRFILFIGTFVGSYH
ncbi:uncharacterized protein PHACADRAFT_247756 [Phanerochaete carnosa HHB-10118-sp]|uniref:Uncharacterized protein n=1 Tax=Phanerochaete carnosa (strain HHB-10118-sp) TaxID=650164 RepID=K5WP80_PHACS|nr:uncharacterized protein PHACADRAFT_247756 [Phanerochaete carnosa HHB-10118-sp]EKM61265.1 hypothetical protein PHACADRAFT_247756 [Phanerochaete carnosa HHB-10118-sp]